MKTKIEPQHLIDMYVMVTPDERYFVKVWQYEVNKSKGGMFQSPWTFTQSYMLGGSDLRTMEREVYLFMLDIYAEYEVDTVKLNIKEMVL